MTTETDSLIQAVRDKNMNRIRGMVQEQPALVRERDEKGVTPLLVAVEEDLPEAVSLLLDNGADIREMDNHGFTVLHLVKSRALAIELLGRGADVNIANNYSKTPLHIAVIDDEKEIVALFLEHGADVHAEDNKKYTPLMMALEYKLPEIEALLREHGA
jgi:uncharacterized protein